VEDSSSGFKAWVVATLGLSEAMRILLSSNAALNTQPGAHEAKRIFQKLIQKLKQLLK
jgi:hypothetical protein